ncbi:hypothetical protein [Haladaptatus paucihalophilus]|uniref:Uncharacterized protein n=1 Tax=Haladaptatus paucihalophilus DX253 TaxID=797209 RepID=A0A1M6X7Z5_HALPU|nr:hypothetical protein [Haladaptatus paucihalophilus]SHL02107.1 hypothetical protein SAMN05444342_2763 [Haladaptatus paucihalophilus DX253]
MSVVIENKSSIQFDKKKYDAEFDVPMETPDIDDDEFVAKADDSWCLITCGVFTCTITG